ncbi:MAG TPA: hypothetical protein V6C65_38945 [Allocoleopsis sp.]
MVLDIERFQKIASRMHSDNDHEALIAARQCTKLLIEAGMHWSNLSSIFVPTKKQTNREPNSASVADVLSYIEYHQDLLSPSSKAFFESLNSFFTINGYLTPKQEQSLDNLLKQIQGKQNAKGKTRRNSTKSSTGHQ